MSKYYRLTFIVLGAVLAGLVVLTLVSLSYSKLARDRKRTATEKLDKITEEVTVIETRQKNLERDMKPVDTFVRAWAPAISEGASKDLSLTLPYSLMDAGARKFGLTANAPRTPPAKDISFLGRSYRVQPVTVSGSLNSLVKLCSWLGDVEQTYPYARVEEVTLAAASAGGNLTMKISLQQPITQEDLNKKANLGLYPLNGFEPGVASTWNDYLPQTLKGAEVVNLPSTWNPLLPTSPENSAITYLPTDETSAKIQNAFDSLIQTVIRAPNPAACGAMIAGRIYHVGDEVYDRVANTGGVRPKKIGYLAGCIVKLSAIREDSIVFQVSVIPTDLKKAPTTVNATFRLPPTFCVSPSNP